MLTCTAVLGTAPLVSQSAVFERGPCPGSCRQLGAHCTSSELILLFIEVIFSCLEGSTGAKEDNGLSEMGMACRLMWVVF